MTHALRVHALTKSYGRARAVDGLTFEVPRGTLTALIGPNGAGKSTTMRMIAGLQLADEGEITIDGRSVVRDLELAKSLCTLVPQELALFDYLTGEESLRFVGAIRGVDDDTLTAELQRWLTLTELDGAKHKIVREYSGGMKRKLAIAAALIGSPPLVLLDESFTGLDPESTYALQGELRRYCDAGGTVLLSSHILDMVQAIADHVVLMADGKHLESFDRAALDAVVASEGSLTRAYLKRIGKLPDEG